MSNPSYTLEIISHHPKFESKSLRKYYVDGIETVGAWGDEPFEIRFKNNTWQKLQVKLSVDGTDILTGNPATTEPSEDMWVVNGYDTLSLRAWPETSNGGAQFVFTSANNSVAIHTHGDLSCRGIVAAAVFVEGHVEPIKLSPVVIEKNHYYPVYPYYSYQYLGGCLGDYNITVLTNTGGNSIGGGGTYSCNSINLATDQVESSFRSLDSLAAVGAGQHVDQKITYITGLIKPTFTETVRVKYMWWDDLVAKLKETNTPAPHASGFPGDKKQQIMSLGKTPRIGEYKGTAFPRQQEHPSYSRV